MPSQDGIIDTVRSMNIDAQPGGIQIFIMEVFMNSYDSYSKGSSEFDDRDVNRQRRLRRRNQMKKDFIRRERHDFEDVVPRRVNVDIVDDEMNRWER